MTASTTEARNRAGSAGQQDVLKANNELDLSRNDIANMQSMLVSQQAVLNALLNRSPQASLPVPTDQPTARSIAYHDGELIDLAVKYNPELAALAAEIHGREDGIRLAKLQYVPDFNLSTGSDLMGISQSILGQATIPILRRKALDAAIAQANANLRASEAMHRQAKDDFAAQVTGDIAFIRDADRQIELFEHVLLPRARLAANIGRSAYESGHASLLDLLDGERSLITISRLIANLKTAREKHLVELESITTVDLSPQVIVDHGVHPR